MTEIQILSVNRQQNNNYIELQYKMTFTLPSIWGTGSTPIAGIEKIVAAYPEKYSVEVIPVTGTVVTVTETNSIAADSTQNQIRTKLEGRYGALRAKLDSLTLDVWDQVAGLSWNGTTWTTTDNITDNPIGVNLGVTATGVAAAAVTLTLPAAVGKFHSISLICIQAYSTAARTGSATPIVVTSTNLPGSPAWTFATAGAIGTTDLKIMEPRIPIKSLVANTATTIVCPVTTGVIWRIIVFYENVNN